MDVKCPFCEDDEFDLIGLKNHILNSCDKFDEIEELFNMFPKNTPNKEDNNERKND